MTKFSKKAVLATALVAGLIGTSIVYAATTGGMHSGFMASMDHDQMGPGQMEQFGAMMGNGAMMGHEFDMGQMPEMTSEQLAFMSDRLANLSDQQRAIVEKRVLEHGITLPPRADAPTTK